MCICGKYAEHKRVDLKEFVMPITTYDPDQKFHISIYKVLFGLMEI